MNKLPRKQREQRRAYSLNKLIRHTNQMYRLGSGFEKSTKKMSETI